MLLGRLLGVDLKNRRDDVNNGRKEINILMQSCLVDVGGTQFHHFDKADTNCCVISLTGEP